ncbi:MAG: Chorismate mutase type [Pseudomonadota bacterium]|jgi:chorismate mutase
MKPTSKKPIQTPRQELAAARNEIAQLDSAFLEAFAAFLKRRKALAREVGRIKRAAGLPIRDPAVEQRVHARFSARLGRYLPKSFVHALTAAVLRASRREQSRN